MAGETIRRASAALRVTGPGEAASRFERLVFALTALVAFVALTWSGARLGPDGAPLAGAVTEAPLYSALLAAHGALLEAPAARDAGSYDLLAAWQVLIGLAAAWWLGRSLRTAFGLPRWIGFLASLVLLLPYALGTKPFGTTIAAEALAYPLFLVALSCLFHGFARGDWRWLIAFIVLLPLQVLASKQLAFVAPAFVLLLAWLLWAYPGPRRPKVILAGLLAAALLAGALAERLTVQAKSGHFSPLPVAGRQMIAVALYLAEDDDGALFRAHPERRALFGAFRREMALRNLRVQDIAQGPVPTADRASHFQASREAIVRQAVLPALRKAGIREPFAIDRETRQMSYRLLGEQPLAWLCLTGGTVVKGLGGPYPAAFLLLVFALTAAAQTRHRAPWSLALASVLLFHLANITGTALIGADIAQATGHTAPPTLALLMIALWRVSEHGAHDQTDRVEST